MSQRNPYRISMILGMLSILFVLFLSSAASAQAAPQLEPVALCLLDRGPNAAPRYEAHFGHRNNTEQSFSIPAGVGGSGINELLGGAAIPALPTDFLAGPNFSGEFPDSAFYVEFDGTTTTSVSWTLGTSEDLNGTPVTATVSLESPLCSYEIIIEKTWLDLNGNPSPVPPLDLPAEWRIDVVAFTIDGQALGSGNCLYLLPDTTLRCLFSNPGSNVTDSLLVPTTGSYNVAETPVDGWINTEAGGVGDGFVPIPEGFCDESWFGDPALCRHLVTNAPGNEGGSGTLVIRKFNDLNGDGVKTSDEPYLANWPVSALNSSGVARNELTSADGSVTLTNLATGVYIVSEGTLDAQCWEQTAPRDANNQVIAQVSVQVNNQSTTEVVFGNRNTCEPTPTQTSTVEPTPTETPTVEPTPTETPTEALGCQRNNPERLDCSSLEVTAVCDGTTAVFTITNTGEAGNGDMRAPTQYRIIVDGVVVQTGTVQIAGGASMTVTYSGGGRVTLEADQQVGHPGRSQPQATVNCR